MIGVGIGDKNSETQGGDSKYCALKRWSCVRQGHNLGYL